MKISKIITSLVMLLIALTFAHLSFAVEIKGKVVAIEGSKAKIEYQSKYAPRKGDKVQIGAILGGLFIPVEGDWRVVDVSRDSVWAESKSADTGKPEANYIAIIQSENPMAREIEPPARKQAIRQTADGDHGKENKIPDPASNISWTESDLGDNYVWFQAYSKCKNLELGGYTDWELPSIEELEALYKSGKVTRQHHIKLNGCCAWSADFHQEKRKRFLLVTTYTDYAWVFDFHAGKRIDQEWTKTDGGKLARHPGIHVLCVRRESN